MKPAETNYTETDAAITRTEPNKAHPLPLAAHVIETELAAIVASTAVTVREGTAAVRQAFTLGTDHGKALILSAAADMFGTPVENAEAEQAHRSNTAVADWCEKSDSEFSYRSYSIRRTCFTDPGKAWGATAHSLNTGDPIFYGASHAEALAKLATWCTEYTAAHPVQP